MKKWMSAVCVLMAVLFITGCGKDKSFNPSVSSLYIEKNGEITQAIVESFAQEYYSLDEFSAMVQKEVDVYNQKLGETKITVESTEVKDSVMYLKRIMRMRIRTDFIMKNICLWDLWRTLCQKGCHLT